MANFFDQFDGGSAQSTGGGNYFDQFDGHATPTPSVGPGEDLAKAIPSGLASGAIGVAGMPGDLQNLAAKFSPSDYISGKIDSYFPNAAKFLKEESARTLKHDSLGLADHSADALNVTLPRSDQLQSAVEGVTGPLYKAQTTPGQFAQTVSEFAPAALGGVGSLGRRLFTNAVVPGIASETAGQLTQGTSAEPYARIGGALLGGAGASKIANGLAERSAIKAATPALADVKSEATNAYDALTSRNVAIPLPQSTLDSVANDIQTTLNNKGIRPSVAKGIHDAVEELRTPATHGAADVADLVAARQSIKNLLGSPDASKAGAFVALPKIEQAIEQSSPGTMAKIREADKNYAAAKAGEALDKRMTRADLRAAGEHSGLNVGNKIKQQVTNYLLSNEAKYLPAETKAELEKIVRGTWTSNGMRAVANLLGGGGGLGMVASAGAGYEAGGWPGAVAAGLAGRTLKSAGNRATIKQAERVGQSIRARSPLGQQNLPALPPASNPALQGLMSALLARQQANQ